MLIERLISCSEIDSENPGTVSFVSKKKILSKSPYSRSAPQNLSIENLDPQQGGVLSDILNSLESETKDINIFEFSDAIVLGQGTVLFPDGKLLTDSAAEFLNHGIVPDGISGTISRMSISEPVKRISGSAILVKRPWYRNFGHYLVDLMPIVPLAHASFSKISSIIYGDIKDHPLTPLVREINSYYYPNASVLFVDDTVPLMVEKLYYWEPIHVPPLFKHPMAISVTKKVSEGLFLSSSERKTFGDRLYISRKNATTRRISNESQLQLALKKFGFNTFCPEEHSFSDQISAFKQAHTIVGSKGAAFTNIMFSQPGSNVILLSPPRFVDPFFWDLACICKIKYSELFCSTCKGENSADDIEVDINKLLQIVELL